LANAKRCAEKAFAPVELLFFGGSTANNTHALFWGLVGCPKFTKPSRWLALTQVNLRRTLKSCHPGSAFIRLHLISARRVRFRRDKLMQPAA
jgi:hypothetical protein